MKKTIIAIATLITVVSCKKQTVTPVNIPPTVTKDTTFIVNVKPQISFDGVQLLVSAIATPVVKGVEIKCSISYDWDSANIFKSHYVIKEQRVNITNQFSYVGKKAFTVINHKIDSCWVEKKPSNYIIKFNY